jgi:hypothetical protein
MRTTLQKTRWFWRNCLSLWIYGEVEGKEGRRPLALLASGNCANAPLPAHILCLAQKPQFMFFAFWDVFLHFKNSFEFKYGI